MRLRFPQDNTSFLYTGPGEPIRQPWVTQLTLYTDSTLSTLADIRDAEGNPLPGSIVYITSDGLIPNFLGPDDGTTVLWALPPDETAYPVIVQMDSYVDYKVSALVGGAPPPLDTLDGLAQAVINLQARVTALETP